MILKYERLTNMYKSSIIENFISLLLNGKAIYELHSDFEKYYNDKFEILIFDDNVLVKDKRQTHKIIIYNSIKIAKAKLFKDGRRGKVLI